MNRKVGILLLVTVIISAMTGAIAVQILDTEDAQNSQFDDFNSQSQNLKQPQNIKSSSLSTVQNIASNQYSKLYGKTIDSVVMIRAINERGKSIGSGFIYDRSGHIVTNEHVINNADTIQVRFRSGIWRNANIIGQDVYTDLAVLKVGNLPEFAAPLPIAAENPEEGKAVAALGSPFGLEGSITSGIISGVNRSMSTRRGFSIPATIQIDAPLNPGNSGGPLLNMNGTVIGVNRATQGDNVGFAISPLLINKVVPKLIKDGEYNHPYLGVSSTSVTPTIARIYGLSKTSGVMVVNTIRGTPAEGVLEPSTETRIVNGRRITVGGDIILSIDGQKIRDQQDLSRYLMLNASPGEKIDIKVIRDGERTTVSLTLANRPEPFNLPV